MGLTIVLGLVVLSVANYGSAHEYQGIEHSVQGTTQLKPTIPTYPFSTNQAPINGGQVKTTTFGVKNIGQKSFGTPFDPFKPAHPQYQPGPLRSNYQPFGPYPGYPGPVVYPGHGGYTNQGGYPYQGGYHGHGGHHGGYNGGFGGYYQPPAYRHEDFNQKPFGFQPYPVAAPGPQPTFNPSKFGPAKKFNKNFAGLDFSFNQPGKYFQEHLFGVHHGHEFPSAIVPAEHNIKQSRPKDTGFEKPVVPTIPAYGFGNTGVFGFASPPAFGYQVPQFPVNQPFIPATPSTKTAPSAVGHAVDVAIVEQKVEKVEKLDGDAAAVTEPPASPARDESATVQQQAAEVTDGPSEAPAADPQPAVVPAQEEVVAATETPSNNDAPPAAVDDAAAAVPQQSAPSEPEVGEPGAGDADVSAPVNSVAESGDSGESAANEFTGSTATAATEDEQQETSSVANAPADESAAAVDGGTDESAVRVDEPKEVNTDTVPETKPAETEVPVNVPSAVSNELVSSAAGPGLVSDPSSVGLFPPSSIPYFAAAPPTSYQEPSYVPAYSREQIDLRNSFYAPFGFSEGFNGGVISPGNVVPVTGTPVAKSTEKSAESDEKKVAVKSDIVTEAPKKVNTVQIIQDDPFNGKLPQLYDPSNAGSALDSYRFYNHPSVSALSSQASLASYSPEDAFTNFGTQFHQAYFVEGSPTLTPLPKTILQNSQTPISISSKDHPLHSQIFKYTGSFVPYPVQAGNGAGSFQTFDFPSSLAAVAATSEARSKSDSPAIVVAPTADSVAVTSDASATASAAADAVPSSMTATAVEASSTETA